MAESARPSALTESVGALLTAARSSAVTPAAAAALTEAQERLTGPLRLAIAGKVKAGKSTLLNALVGEELAPTDAGECTSIVTWYSDGDHPEVTLHPSDGPPVRTTYRRAGGALDIDLGGRAPAQISRIDVRWPSSRLRDLTLIDTPGMESISTDLSAKTLQVLTPETDAPPAVDAVLYLLRHAHASDARFLEAFHDTDLAHGTPMNTVGVLSRADEIGSCRVDALEVADRVARRYRTEPRLRRLCPVIVPVAGLLGHAGVTLREHEYRTLATLGSADDALTSELLLTADRFATRPTPLDLDAEVRGALLDRLGLFGIRLSIDLVRRGTVRNSSDLARELVDRSGLEVLRSVLLRQFSERSKILKARSALLSLESVLRTDGCSNRDVLRSRIEQITSSAHAFEEVRLLDRLRSEVFNLPDVRRNELERILGGSGHDPASRVGLPVDAAGSEVQAAAVEALHRWQSIAEHPLSGRNEQLAARGACRSLEGILAEAR